MSTPHQNEFDFTAPLSTARTAPQRRIWRVQELVGAVRDQMERDYQSVWVAGDLSGCRKAPSGHLYFTLKDDEAQLSAVMFRRQAALLRFAATDGVQVIARGKLSVYDQRGQLQLIAETLEPRGDGVIRLAFQQLYNKLKTEGLFAQERKRPLPAFPRCIGIITSPAGAVIHDLRTIVARRHSRLNITIYPALVQGPTAALEAIHGLRYFNESRSVDLIVLARGGGSPEDLACYNDEGLARAVAASAIPVLSAIGHETDHTIVDFAADQSAPTPSAAAELITEQQHRVEERLALLEQRLDRSSRYQIMRQRERLSRLGVASVLARTQEGFARRQQRLDDFRFRLDAAVTAHLRRKSHLVLTLEARVFRHSAGRQLGDAKYHVDDLRLRLHSALSNQLRLKSHSLLLLGSRLLRRAPEQQFNSMAQRYGSLHQRLLRLPSHVLAPSSSRLQKAQARLVSLSPTAVLQRGYALVFDGSGNLIKDADNLAPQQVVTTRLARGSFTSTVIATTLEQKRDQQLT